MSPTLMATGWLALAVVLEVTANVLLAHSRGFRRRVPAALSIVCVLAAFTLLAQSVRHLDLTVAYALWGGAGILVTAAAGAILFGQHLSNRGLVGIAILLTSLGLLKFG